MSKVLQGYFVNFILTGNPNGKGLVEWPSYKGESGWKVLRVDVKTTVEEEKGRERYLAIEGATKR